MISYISYSQLARDVRTLANVLRGKIDGVIGIPRSGMIAALMLGEHLNLPVVSVQEFCEVGFSCAKSGPRLLRDRPAFESQPMKGSAVLLDDSVHSGMAMKFAAEQIADADHPNWRICRAAVYGSPDAPEGLLHYCGESLAKPRFFEWNWTHHADMKNALWDMDGVICHDPDVIDDDGENYDRAIGRVWPKYLPTLPIGGIVTGRLERWRPHTEDWLRRHGVQYGSLTMGKWESADRRRASGAVAHYKASVYRESNAWLFVESDIEQAIDIQKMSGKPVFCPDLGDIQQ